MSESEYTCFDVEVRDHVAHLVLKRPEKANSMILEFWKELPEITEEITSGSDARVVVLSAIGRHFSSGMDLSVFGDFGDPTSGVGGGQSSRTRAQIRNTALRAQQTFNALEQSRLPVIAAIQGACVGGGVDMVSACDLRYATQDAFFTIQEINIGMTADVGTLQRMPKLVPEGVVRELAFTGRRMDAEEALDRGFVNAVYHDHDSMMEAVGDIAAQIAAKSPMAIWGTKQSMNFSRDHSVADGLEYIATWNAAMFDTDDMGEAFRAQMERRDPDFPDHRPMGKGFGA
ncbi:crotonase/enoyl-CoA hydratase family protein [Candidatus Poriferisodalis sp.]|uniref:crotonase/enoyl-CoA hydratase family protein n=1 Tax=Candidatus Poriferisodalis sp. TaxID=3101277 RepID=UPI003B013EEB